VWVLEVALVDRRAGDSVEGSFVFISAGGDLWRRVMRRHYTSIASNALLEGCCWKWCLEAIY
jgi:hypothetical protein